MGGREGEYEGRVRREIGLERKKEQGGKGESGRAREREIQGRAS